MLRSLFTLMILQILLGSNYAAYGQVGINKTTPLSTLDINGNLSIKTIGIPISFNGGGSGNATQINDGVYISLMPSPGSAEFILPNAVNFPGRIYILRNISNSNQGEIYTFAGQFFAKDSNTATPQPFNYAR